MSWLPLFPLIFTAKVRGGGRRSRQQELFHLPCLIFQITPGTILKANLRKDEKWERWEMIGHDEAVYLALELRKRPVSRLRPICEDWSAVFFWDILSDSQSTSLCIQQWCAQAALCMSTHSYSFAHTCEPRRMQGPFCELAVNLHRATSRDHACRAPGTCLSLTSTQNSRFLCFLKLLLL